MDPTPTIIVNVPNSTASWLTPVLVVSALALTFTVLSFWWIQVRRGRLVSFAPQTYAGR